MGMPSIVFLVLLLCGAWLGFRAGFQKTAVRLLAFIGAYALAIAFFIPLSQTLKQQWDKPWLLVYFVTATILLFGGSWLLSLILNGIFSLFASFSGNAAKKLAAADDAKTEEVHGRSPAGAVLGAGVAAMMAMVIIWALSLMSAAFPKLIPPSQNPNDQQLQQLANTSMASVTAKVLAKAGGSDKAQGFAKAIIKNPIANMERVKRVSASEPFRKLMGSEYSRQLMLQKDTRALSRQPEFQELLSDPDIQSLAADAGLAVGNAQGEEQMATAMVDVWAQADRLRHDPRVQELLQDPDVVKQIQSGDYLGLMSNPKFELLMSAFTEGMPAQGSPGEPALDAIAEINGERIEANPEPAPKKPETKIYRWVDENGRQHFSDKKPKDQ